MYMNNMKCDLENKTRIFSLQAFQQKHSESMSAILSLKKKTNHDLVEGNKRRYSFLEQDCF